MDHFQILLLSGVGPRKQLQEHKIPVVHDLPGVGAQLLDHPVVDFYFSDKTKTAPSYMIPHSLTDLVKYTSAVFQFLFQRWGTLATNVSNLRFKGHLADLFSGGKVLHFVDLMTRYYFLRRSSQTWKFRTVPLAQVVQTLRFSPQCWDTRNMDELDGKVLLVQSM